MAQQNNQQPFVPFNLKKAYNLIEKRDVEKGNKKESIVFDDEKAKKYIQEYWFALSNGEVAKKIDHELFQMMKNREADESTFGRLEHLQNWFHKQNRDIYELVNDINKPKIGHDDTTGRFLNFFGGYKHAKKPYDNYSDDIKSKVNFFNSYIKEVICSNNDLQYTYIIKWLAKMAQKGKNKSIIYCKGIEGIGKSTLTTFMRENVLGTKIAIKSDLRPITSNFNGELRGIVFVVFEEMPTISTGQWSQVSGKLKTMASETVETYENKNENRIPNLPNLNSFWINTNVDALCQSTGRRIMIPDLSAARLKDYDYFQKLNDECCNDIIGEAYYNYLLTINLDDFNEESDIPETKNKQDAGATFLKQEYKFLKEIYLLKKKGIENKKIKTLYQEYVDHHKTSVEYKKPLALHQFNASLREIGCTLSDHPVGGYHVYTTNYEKLNSIAEKMSWYHELDFESDENDNDNNYNNFLDEGIETQSNIIIEAQNKEIENLKKYIDTLQKENNELKEKLTINKEKVIEEKSNKIDQLSFDTLDKKPIEEKSIENKPIQLIENIENLLIESNKKFQQTQSQYDEIKNMMEHFIKEQKFNINISDINQNESYNVPFLSEQNIINASNNATSLVLSLFD